MEIGLCYTLELLCLICIVFLRVGLSHMQGSLGHCSASGDSLLFPPLAEAKNPGFTQGSSSLRVEGAGVARPARPTPPCLLSSRGPEVPAAPSLLSRHLVGAHTGSSQSPIHPRR